MATSTQVRINAPESAAGKAITLANQPQPGNAPVAGATVEPLDFPESHPAWQLLAGVPILLDVSVPVRKFCVRELLALEVGSIVQSTWSGTTDVPLCCDGVQLCWTEFEMAGKNIGVRLTMLG